MPLGCRLHLLVEALLLPIGAALLLRVHGLLASVPEALRVIKVFHRRAVASDVRRFVREPLTDDAVLVFLALADEPGVLQCRGGRNAVLVSLIQHRADQAKLLAVHPIGLLQVLLETILHRSERELGRHHAPKTNAHGPDVDLMRVRARDQFWSPILSSANDIFQKHAVLKIASCAHVCQDNLEIPTLELGAIYQIVVCLHIPMKNHVRMQIRNRLQHLLRDLCE
mmetsp:Transcript_52734/g.150403  ORF Transcript_52734/g.150403 Transcript_52734/m.150403 type:complete len:225 (-) Transcript_52734:480-1154(-)